MGGIGEAIEGAARYVAEHPDEAAYTDGPAMARLEAGLRVVTTGVSGESVGTDMVAAVGGPASAPSPGGLLAAAGAGTLLLLTLYGALLSRRFTGRARSGFVAKWVAAPLVMGYCAYGLLYVSSVNTKDDAVRSVYSATHPLLRMALSTLILADHDAVITDLARRPDDYRRMGLPVNRESLHYRQADGWVHAVDLRTRPGLKSLLVQWYFDLMGFDTLRHVGTHDHLHVSLPVSPG